MSESKEKTGLECPRCGCQHFYVVYTRPRKGRIIRRKECRYCGNRVLTHESIVGIKGAQPH